MKENDHDINLIKIEKKENAQNIIYFKYLKEYAQK